MPATPRAAVAAGAYEAPAGPRTYGAVQKKTRNRKKRERKEAKLASSGGGAAGKGPSSSSASRRQVKSWGTSGAAGSQWSAAAWRNESWGSSGAASWQWSAVAWESVGARRGLRSHSRSPRRLPTPPRDPRRPEQEPQPACGLVASVRSREKAMHSSIRSPIAHVVAALSVVYFGYRVKLLSYAFVDKVLLGIHKVGNRELLCLSSGPLLHKSGPFGYHRVSRQTPPVGQGN